MVPYGEEQFKNKYKEVQIMNYVEKDENNRKKRKMLDELFEKMNIDDDATFNNNIETIRNTINNKPANKPEITISKENFDKMQYKERMQLYTDNNELYQEINKLI